MTRLALSPALAGLLATAPTRSQTRVQIQPLRPLAVPAFGSARQDERDAAAFLASTRAGFDMAKPFVHIVAAHRRPAAMLTDLYTTHGVAVPEDGFTIASQAVPLASETLVDGCRTGAAAETANPNLHVVTLLPAEAACADIPRMTRRLRDASENNHLPASQQAWAETDPSPAPEDLTNHLETVEA